MLTDNQKAAARALLAARAELLRAEFTLADRKNKYIEAEAAYLSHLEYDSASSAYNLLIDGTLVMPKDECFDLPAGSKLEYHTVTVAE